MSIKNINTADLLKSIASSGNKTYPPPHEAIQRKADVLELKYIRLALGLWLMFSAQVLNDRRSWLWSAIFVWNPA